MDKPVLTIEALIEEAKAFCVKESKFDNIELYGVTDGKRIGTYIEQKFQNHLEEKYLYEKGSSSKGIDLPASTIQTDIKVTAATRPQSSCPFKSVEQKIFGLGYHILLFVYKKTDYKEKQYSTLEFVNCCFINKNRTADYTTTFRLRQMVEDGANEEDIVSYLTDRNLPADEMTLYSLANTILEHKPYQGYLTVSNAFQWRLKYKRVLTVKADVEGIITMLD